MKNSAHLLQLFPDGGGRAISMHSRVCCGTRLRRQFFKLWSKTLPILENTWDVAWHAETAFGGIRLEKHERSQNVGIDFWHSARLERMKPLLASWPCVISAGNIEECVLHRVREKVRLRWWCAVDTERGFQKLRLDRRCFRISDPDQAKCFVSLLFLCCHFIRGWVSALSLLPALILCRDSEGRHTDHTETSYLGQPGVCVCVCVCVFRVPHLTSTVASAVNPHLCIAVLLCI